MSVGVYEVVDSRMVRTGRALSHRPCGGRAAGTARRVCRRMSAMRRVDRRIMAAAAGALAMVTLTGASLIPMPDFRWMWVEKPAPELYPADELLVTLGDTPAVGDFRQYWKRN